MTERLGTLDKQTSGAAVDAPEEFRFSCPTDETLLVRCSSSQWACPKCRRNFADRDGILDATNGTDQFYEGAYVNRVHFKPRSESVIHSWPLWLIRDGYLWEVRRRVRAGATVMELGCASGVDYFAARYRMIGCDLSLRSLSNASKIYSACAQVDARAGLPVPSQSVDAVVSSFFWEHIAPRDKDVILHHLYRILKPTGVLVFLYDIETQNPVIAHMRAKDGARYQDVFLERDGHVGYETMEENRATFERAGFRVLRHRSLGRTFLQPPDVFAKLRQWPSVASHFFAMGARLGKPPLNYAYIALLRLVDTVTGPLLPVSWGRIAMTVCVKAEEAADSSEFQ